MIERELFLLIDSVLRSYGSHPFATFGRVCVVFVGDFYQLPPVKASLLCNCDEFRKIFAPELTFVLSSQHRQTGDRITAEIVQRIRDGCPTREEIARFRANEAAYKANEAAFPGLVELRPLNVEVDRYNDDRLAALGCKIHVYDRRCSGSPQGIALLKDRAIE